MRYDSACVPRRRRRRRGSVFLNVRSSLPPYLPLRSADLSGQVLDTPLALEWGRRILEEFRSQAALEAAAGLPMTVVASGDMETTMKGQHFFASKVSVGVDICVVVGVRVGGLRVCCVVRPVRRTSG